MFETELCGERVVLLPQRAMYWPAARTLLIADPHLGKADTFRRAGIPVPHASTLGDLRRLAEAVAQTDAKRLIVLGDFFHARPSEGDAALSALAAWRERRPSLEVLVLPGNHDRHAGPPPTELGFEAADEAVDEGPFRFTHHPGAHEGAYVLAGHVHPGVRVGGRHMSQTLPCFHFTQRCGVLPAFGRFTGYHCIQPEPGDRCYAIGDETVFDVPTTPPRRRIAPRAAAFPINRPPSPRP